MMYDKIMQEYLDSFEEEHNIKRARIEIELLNGTIINKELSKPSSQETKSGNSEVHENAILKSISKSVDSSPDTFSTNSALDKLEKINVKCIGMSEDFIAGSDWCNNLWKLHIKYLKQENKSKIGWICNCGYWNPSEKNQCCRCDKGRIQDKSEVTISNNGEVKKGMSSGSNSIKQLLDKDYSQKGRSK